MRKEISSFKEENGNITFCYRPIKYRNVMLLAFIPFYFVLALIGTKISITIWLMLAFFSIIISGFLMMFMRDKANNRIEKTIIKRLIEKQIKSDLKSIDSTLRILEQYYKRTDNNDSMTYGYREYHIVLSDGREMIFQIINPQLFKEVLKLEIDVHYSISQ